MVVYGNGKGERVLLFYSLLTLSFKSVLFLGRVLVRFVRSKFLEAKLVNAELWLSRD